MGTIAPFKRILFYSDSPVWGGHEEMTLLFANSVAKIGGVEVVFVYHHPYFNKKLSDSIEKISIDITTKTPLPCLRSFAMNEIFFLKKLFIQKSPEVIIVSQGCIERSLKGVFAAMLSGAKVVSYIPLAFKFKETNSVLGAFRDVINKIYYRLPNSYITVSQYQQKLLSRFITPKQSVKLLYNPTGNTLGNAGEAEPIKFSEHLSLLCAGRIYFKHKNQSILVEVAKIMKERKFSAKFIIAGEGPDTCKLKKEIALSKVDEYFEIVGWVENLKDTIKNGCDMLIVPSFYESCLPLTVLEACSENKPFLVSDKNFSAEYNLDPNFTFNCESPTSIADKIMNFKKQFSQSTFQATKRKILDIHNNEKYSIAVKNTVSSLFEGQSNTIS